MISCDFCFRKCRIEEGRYGLCESRCVRNGHLISPFYSQLCAIAVDPVEKKPLYHFMPGTKTLSIAEEGCNFFCSFCQNYEIARYHKKREEVSPSSLIEYALENGIPSISYTYSEPLVWQDYMLSVAKKARKAGILNIMVTNGSFSENALERILPFIDAYNIDLKGDEKFYNEIVKASSVPVRRAIEEIVRYNSHLEVTTMVIEGIHTKDMIRELGVFLYNAGVKVWHLSRFFPHYLMTDRKETSEEYLEEVYQTARESGVPFIYKGNTRYPNKTVCPICGEMIERIRSKGICSRCKTPIYGKF